MLQLLLPPTMPLSDYLPLLAFLKTTQLLLTLAYCLRPLVSDITTSQDFIVLSCLLACTFCHSSGYCPFFVSRQLTLNYYLRLRWTSLLFMAMFWMRPLLALRHHFRRFLPSWRMIRLFQRSRLLPEITRDFTSIETTSIQSSTSTTIALINVYSSLLKLPSYIGVRSLGSFSWFYACQPIAWHCMSLRVQPYFMSAWTFL